MNLAFDYWSIIGQSVLEQQVWQPSTPYYGSHALRDSLYHFKFLP